MSENLFSYGTLQKDSVQIKLFGRLLKGAKDVLKGYKLVSVEITDEAFLGKDEEKFQRTIIRSNDIADAVEGMIFELSREELIRADRYEPDNYKRVKVTLLSGKSAWIYLAAQIR